MTVELEYTGLMALAWDPLRGDTSDWEDRALYLELIGELGQPVLDVGCGTGRLLLDFLALGIDIDGLEISPDMLDILRGKAKATGVDISGRLHQGAMESYELARRYRVVLVPSSSFQLLTDPADAARAMRRLYRWLSPGGTLVMPWIDIPKDYPDGGDDVFERERALPDGTIIRRSYRAWYDPVAGLEHTDDRYELLRDGVVVAHERKLRSPAVRQYDRAAIAALHAAAGFTDLRFLSEFTREPAQKDDRIVSTFGEATRGNVITSNAAVHNNAVWCDAVCRALGCETLHVDGLWVKRSPAPPYYSNTVTLQPDGVAAQLGQVRTMLGSPLPRPWTIKDGFHVLDLAPLGFEVLFEASWIGLAAGDTLAAGHAEGVTWSAVSSDVGLIAWESAWRGGNDAADAAGLLRLFQPALLAVPAIRFLAGRRDGDIVAVAVANRSDDGTGPVVGVSNIVLPTDDPEHHRTGAVTAVRAAYPGLPMVGYERGDDLAAMVALGFRTVGDLRVSSQPELSQAARPAARCQLFQRMITGLSRS